MWSLQLQSFFVASAPLNWRITETLSFLVIAKFRQVPSSVIKRLVSGLLLHLKHCALKNATCLLTERRRPMHFHRFPDDFLNLIRPKALPVLSAVHHGDLSLYLNEIIIRAVIGLLDASPLSTSLKPNLNQERDCLSAAPSVLSVSVKMTELPSRAVAL